MAAYDELALGDDEGELLTDEAQAELAVLAALEVERAETASGAALTPESTPSAGSTSSPESTALESTSLESTVLEQAGELERLRAELDEARGGFEAERAARHAAVARYREAVLAAEPALPSDLVGGESLEEVDASVEAARRAVAQIRERLALESEAEAARGFPAGAPGRLGAGTEGLSPGEKIAFGLERRPGG